MCVRGGSVNVSVDCGGGSTLSTAPGLILAWLEENVRLRRSVGWPTTLVRRPRHDADASRRFDAQAPVQTWNEQTRTGSERERIVARLNGLGWKRTERAGAMW